MRDSKSDDGENIPLLAVELESLFINTTFGDSTSMYFNTGHMMIKEDWLFVWAHGLELNTSWLDNKINDMPLSNSQSSVRSQEIRDRTVTFALINISGEVLWQHTVEEVHRTSFCANQNSVYMKFVRLTELMAIDGVNDSFDDHGYLSFDTLTGKFEGWRTFAPNTLCVNGNLYTQFPTTNLSSIKKENSSIRDGSIICLADIITSCRQEIFYAYGTFFIQSMKSEKGGGFVFSFTYETFEKGGIIEQSGEVSILVLKVSDMNIVWHHSIAINSNIYWSMPNLLLGANTTYLSFRIEQNHYYIDGTFVGLPGPDRRRVIIQINDTGVVTNKLHITTFDSVPNYEEHILSDGTYLVSFSATRAFHIQGTSINGKMEFPLGSYQFFFANNLTYLNKHYLSEESESHFVRSASIKDRLVTTISTANQFNISEVSFGSGNNVNNSTEDGKMMTLFFILFELDSDGDGVLWPIDKCFQNETFHSIDEEGCISNTPPHVTLETHWNEDGTPSCQMTIIDAEQDVVNASLIIHSTNIDNFHRVLSRYSIELEGRIDNYDCFTYKKIFINETIIIELHLSDGNNPWSFQQYYQYTLNRIDNDSGITNFTNVHESDSINSTSDSDNLTDNYSTVDQSITSGQENTTTEKITNESQKELEMEAPLPVQENNDLSEKELGLRSQSVFPIIQILVIIITMILFMGSSKGKH